MKQNQKIVLLLFFALLFVAERAFAIPSFARQTGAACDQCHTSYPGLTEFGRLFKVTGYTMTAVKQVSLSSNETMPGVSLNQIPNLSLILQVDESHLKKGIPGQQNTHIDFPKELGLYYAGRITPALGAFLQVTYDSGGSFGMDASDVRYSRTTGQNIWGLDLNNGPTLEDLWNSTPAYGWPYVESTTGIEPVTPFLASDTVFANTLGVGAYNYWHDLLYAYVGVYQSAKQGDTPATNAAITGGAPYFRFAWTPSNNLELGTFGFLANYQPNDVGSGSTQRYRDIGIDSQYQLPTANSIYVAHARYIWEQHSNLSGTVDGYTGPDSLNNRFLNIDASWYHAHRYGLGLGYFRVQGDQSNLYHLLNDSTDGNGFAADSTPDTDGAIVQADYFPWQNVRWSLQYINFWKYNGASTNYDGNGRNAADNNTLLLNLLLGF